jgi:hypothetical protein
MIKRTMKLTLILGGLLAMGGCNNDNSSNPVDRVSIILTAFGDASSGETQPFLNVLENRVDRTSASAFCKGVYEGELSGQSVVIVTTGTGSDNSGPCTQELLSQYGARIKEIIWSGIGGATPAVGGLVNSAGQMRHPIEPVMIGDVCISALSWNYDLHFSSVTDWANASRTAGHRYNPAGGWWPMKDSDGETTVIGFDNVQLFTIADKALADELLAAAQQVLWPLLDPDVLPKVERYFSTEQIRSTRVFDSTQCAEVASNDFWHGVVEDRLARQYLASLIAVSGYGPATTSEDEVVVFSAMESATWMSIVTRWNQHYGVNIPMAVIRAASNYDHVPLDANGDPKLGPDGKPLTAMDDILLGFEEAGASFAANNAARPVLKLFESRRLPQ